MMVSCREGEYSEGRSPVMSNVYRIPERMKEISESLFIMYNRAEGVYEVHDSMQEGCTLACELPYEELDARALLYVRERHVARFEKLVEEVDRYNERLCQEADRGYMDKAGYKMKQAIRYLDSHESAERLPKEMIEE